MKKSHRNYFINLIVPALLFGSITGAFTSLIVNLYKFCAKHIVHFSEAGYEYMGKHMWLLPIVLAALFLVAWLFNVVYKKVPNLRGGGIPTSIGILQGIFTFKWLRNLVGVFFMSLVSFFVGVPLGTEGPSVQMGTAVGSGAVKIFAGKHKAWERYSMTGGACAGFYTATGAPMSGVMFAIEEAHQRVSPMIIITAAASVMFAGLTNEVVAPLLGVSPNLMPELEISRLSIKDIWIPLAVGLVLGLFAVVFLKYHNVMDKFCDKKFSKYPVARIYAVFILTVVLGLVSLSFISTGHELMLHLFEGREALWMLLAILILRSTATLLANTTGVTGGIFLPLLALGAVLAAIVANVCIDYLGVAGEYYQTIIALGVTACIAGMMKMPLTAILFAVEALGCHNNIVYVIVTATVAYFITELFQVNSINDYVIENRSEKMHQGKKQITGVITVQVKKSSFADEKEIRDIFWPVGSFVLSVKRHNETHGHGAHGLGEGDILQIRYSSYNVAETMDEIEAIVGRQ